MIFPTRERLLQSIEFSRGLADVLLRLLPGALTVVIPYPPGLHLPGSGERHLDPQGQVRARVAQ